MSIKIDDLDEPFRSKVQVMILKLSQLGIKFAITETRRTYLVQADAFRRGASKCDGVRKLSMHQAGLAVDIVPIDEHGRATWDYAKYVDDYKRIGAIGKACGLEWGGDWLPIDAKTGLGWDAPHHEFRG